MLFTGFIQLLLWKVCLKSPGCLEELGCVCYRQNASKVNAKPEHCLCNILLKEAQLYFSQTIWKKR